jgi:predicted murein hydrolase (TIGR00659 family)
MMEIMSTALFGVLVTLVAYEIGLYLNRRTGITMLNPLLVSIVLILVFIRLTGMSYESYNKGGSLISFFIAPATVVLAVPLYRNLQLLKKNLLPILFGVLFGSLVNFFSLLVLFRFTDLESRLLFSLLPKSVTTPIGIELSGQIGGIPEITVAAIVISGLAGVIFGPLIFRILKVDDPVARGVAYGTASHALGTAKAMEEGEIQGGMSGLSIGVAGVITAIIVPVLISLFF